MKTQTLKTIFKQLLYFFAFIICVSFLTYCLMEISPIDPIKAFVTRNMGKGLTAERKAILIAKWGLDQPFLTRYLCWLKNFLHFDLGISMLYNRPVMQVIHEGFLASFGLIFITWLLQGILGVYLGIVAGVKQGSRKDRMIQNYCIVTSATPSFWVALILIMVFAVGLKWFPIGFSTPIGVEETDVTFLDHLYHMVLPILTLVLVGLSNIVLHTREKVIEIMNSDYILFAKARGMEEKHLMSHFALKNILLPAITIQFASFSELFSGIVLTESAFNYPGLGGIAVKAGLNGDMPLILGITVFSAGFVYLGNRLADLLYHQLDPRMKEKAVRK